MITNARFTHYGRMKLMMDQYVAYPPKPTETEIEQTYYAIDMLLFVACLITATYDLTRALEHAGMLRHEIKRAMTRMDTITANVSKKADQVFRARTEHGIADMSLPYMDRAEAAYKIIDESVEGVGEPLEVSKYLSIALALIQLIGEYNDRLSLRFRFDDADKLKQLPAWLKSIKVPLNELAPTIIQQNVTAKNLNIKITE